jgi:sigma-B regulation protein RsbU (phosphoserine phosphatase)
MLAMRSQLDRIAALQRRLLPRSLPQLRGWNLAIHYDVGQWPGGDYYDVLTLPDGRLLLVVGDASDEGGPSAVLVALVRSSLHSCPLSSGLARLPFCQFNGSAIQSPQIILGNLNRLLVENSLEGQFMTMFCGLLSPLEGTFHFANAGHVSPLWWQAKNRGVTAVRDAAGLPLGMGHDTVFHHKRMLVEPGDLLVFYSDGLTTAMNARRDTFGSHRLNELVRASADQGAEAVRDQIVASLRDFQNDQEPQDDVTLLVLERRAQGDYS